MFIILNYITLKKIKELSVHIYSLSPLCITYDCIDGCFHSIYSILYIKGGPKPPKSTFGRMFLLQTVWTHTVVPWIVPASAWRWCTCSLPWIDRCCPGTTEAAYPGGTMDTLFQCSSLGYQLQLYILYFTVYFYGHCRPLLEKCQCFLGIKGMTISFTLYGK